MSGAPLELWHILYVEVWLLFTFDKSIKKKLNMHFIPIHGFYVKLLSLMLSYLFTLSSNAVFLPALVV